MQLEMDLDLENKSGELEEIQDVKLRDVTSQIFFLF